MPKSAALTGRQRKALEELRGAPVPAAPALQRAILIRPPLLYRLIHRAAPVAALSLALSLALLLPGLSIPERWGGPLVLAGGGVVQVSGAEPLTIALPEIRGRMVLQGPGQMQVRGLRRRLLSGRREGEFELIRGELYLDGGSGVPKRLWMETPLLTVRVTGTELLLTHQPAEGSRLLVLRGQAEARPRGGPWRLLPAGAALSVTPEGLPSAVPPKGGTEGRLSTDPPGHSRLLPGGSGPAPGAEGRPAGPGPDRDSEPSPRGPWHEAE